MNEPKDYRLYYYSGYANLIKMPGGHMFKNLVSVGEHVGKLRARGRFKNKQLVLIEFFNKKDKESKIIQIIEPDE